MIDDWFEAIYRMGRSDIENNFTYIGEGISRATYAISEDLVAKFATCLDGVDQNKMEYSIYSHVGRHLKRHLCPIVWYRPGMVVMARAVPLTQVTKIPKVDIYRMGLNRDAMKELKRIIKKYDLLYEDIIDTSSWGLLNNKPVLIDYGCTN